MTFWSCRGEELFREWLDVNLVEEKNPGTYMFVAKPTKIGAKHIWTKNVKFVNTELSDELLEQLKPGEVYKLCLFGVEQPLKAVLDKIILNPVATYEFVCDNDLIRVSKEDIKSIEPYDSLLQV